MPEQNGQQHSWLFSDTLLGTLVVILTIATAFSAYQRALTEIEGGDLDIEAQRNLVVAVGSYLQGSSDFLDDRATYDGIRLNEEQNPEAAAYFRENASPALTAGMSRPAGPFDEQYEQELYGEAMALIQEGAALDAQANDLDDRARLFEMSGLVFSIGLATAAWASIINEGRRLRMLFLIISIISLFVGLVITLQAVLF
jgi:hypothetical protein